MEINYDLKNILGISFPEHACCFQFTGNSHAWGYVSKQINMISGMPAFLQLKLVPTKSLSEEHEYEHSYNACLGRLKELIKKWNLNFP